MGAAEGWDASVARRRDEEVAGNVGNEKRWHEGRRGSREFAALSLRDYRTTVSDSRGKWMAVASA